MLAYLSLLVLGLATQLSSAIQFSSPDAGALLTRGSNLDLTWSSVDTDPTQFSIYLVNFVDWPPFYTPIEYDVPTTKGSATVRVPCDVNTSSGFQLNAINGTNVYIIYAQTPKFSISGSDCKDPVGTYPTCAAAGSTVTVTSTSTVTVSGSSTLTSSTSTSASTSTSTSTATSTITDLTATDTTTTGVTSTSSKASVTAPQGTQSMPSSSTSDNPTTSNSNMPKTIGWNGCYTSPVVLTNPSTTGQPQITPSSSNVAGGQHDPDDVYVFHYETRTITVCPCSTGLFS